MPTPNYDDNARGNDNDGVCRSRLLPGACTLVAALAVGASLPACADAAIVHQLLGRNEVLYHAIARRDRATLARLLAPDFHFATRDGESGDGRAWLDGLATNPDIEAIDNHELRLRSDGDHAWLCGVQRAVVRLGAERIVDEAAFCDRWERRRGEWLVVYAGVPPRTP